MAADPAKSTDPAVQLASETHNLSVQVGNLRSDIIRERKDRRGSNRRFVAMVFADIAFTVLLAGGWVSLHITQTNQAADRRSVAVAQCQGTNKSRAGLRALIATDDQVWHSLVPPHPTPQQQQIIAGIDQRFHTLATLFPDLDCNKVG